MNMPRLNGIHHLKFPVSDLEASVTWYRRVLGAHHLEKFDHFDSAGVRYAVILRLPGIDAAVELRWAPTAVAAIRGYDPVSFVAGSDAELGLWLSHFDAHGVHHSSIITAAAGKLIVFADPDGTYLRILTMPDGGFDAITIDPSAEEPTGPWLMPDLMRHP